MIYSFLKEHLELIVFVLLSIILLVLTSVLYESLSPVVKYVSFLIVFFCFFYLIVRYPFYRKRLIKLEQLNNLETIEEINSHLPNTSSREIQEYQKLYYKLLNQYQKEITLQDQKYQEWNDSLTMWAHQIKTPIAAMHLLMDDKNIPEEKNELFKIEEYVSMVMYLLKTDMLSKDLVLKECSLDAMIGESLKHYSIIFSRSKLRLHYVKTNQMVITDEKWFVFVLEQLLSNALKYTKSGSISIYFENSALVIEDTGCGIREEDLPRIFERGYTGYNGRMDKRSTGLGLYLCKKILTQLGHGIHIESKLGDGTKVFLLMAEENDKTVINTKCISMS